MALRLQQSVCGCVPKLRCTDLRIFTTATKQPCSTRLRQPWPRNRTDERQKAVKKRITLLFFCNSTGTDKDKIMFIGKYRTPVCFCSKSAKEFGFYYRYNKTLWMTLELFEE